MTHTIRHHPDGATLMSYAAAALAEPLSAVVAAHVAMCPRCRSEVLDLERLGSAILMSTPVQTSEAPVPVPKRRNDPAQSGARAFPPSSERIPPPIAAAYNLTFDTIAWKRLGPGIWHHRLELKHESDGDLRLLKIAPGRTMPDHGHAGAELTLVIDGAYSDVTGDYRRGDIQDIDEAIEHRPVVSKDGDCVCLIASEHPARFKGLIGRLLQPWTGM